jgi:hypothetical protein
MYSAMEKRKQNKISLITGSKKRKDLRVSSEDAVLAAMRKTGNNNYCPAGTIFLNSRSRFL